MRFTKISGFTFLELMITMIILTILVAICVPAFNKSVAKAHEQELESNLKLIREANLVYRARHNTNTYLSTVSATVNPPYNLTQLNQYLNLRIFANGKSYTYNSTNGTAYAVQGTGDGVTACIDSTRTAVCCGNVSGTNNVCSTLTTCPSLPGC